MSDPWDDYPAAVLREDLAPRMAPSAKVLRDLLLDRQWHSVPECIELMESASDLKARTIEAMLERLKKEGAVCFSGRRSKKTGDRRTCRIGDWRTQ